MFLKLKKLLFSWNTDKLKINIQDLFNMVTKKLSTKQIDKHLNEINVKGYTCIKVFSQKTIIETI